MFIYGHTLHDYIMLRRSHLQEESIPCKKLCDIVQTIEAISLFKWGYFLFSVQNVHPPDCFRIAHLTEIHLSGLQILVSQNYF